MPDARIRWKPGERERIAKDIRRFNEKIAREAKKGVAGLPPRMKAADVTKAIYSREDFKAFQKLIENAFKPGAFKPGESGITPYEQREAQIRIGIVNRARARAAEKVQAPAAKEMGTEYYNALKPKKQKALSKLGENKQRYLESLRAETKGNYQEKLSNVYIENYLAVARKYIEYPYISQIEQALKKIPADAFITAVQFHDEFQIRFLYNFMTDISLGYKVTKALDELMNDLKITHNFQYDPMDEALDKSNTDTSISEKYQ